MRLPQLWRQHTVTARAYAGTDGMGRPSYAAGVAVEGFLVDQTRLVRSAETGEEVISSATFYCDLDSAGFTPRGRVTLPSGRTAEVVAVGRFSAGSLPLPECLEIALSPTR